MRGRGAPSSWIEPPRPAAGRRVVAGTIGGVRRAHARASLSAPRVTHAADPSILTSLCRHIYRDVQYHTVDNDVVAIQNFSLPPRDALSPLVLTNYTSEV
jgi:hypothetical protein